MTVLLLRYSLSPTFNRKVNKLIIRQTMIYREDLKSNPNLLYVFGDNLKRIGLGGQAGQMRGEPNAHGIATKVSPGMSDEAFFTEASVDYKCVDKDIESLSLRLNQYDALVIPMDGLGSGLAELDVRAPKLFAYLNSRILTLGVKK